jgi:hypothetical protein
MIDRGQRRYGPLLGYSIEEAVLTAITHPTVIPQAVDEHADDVLDVGIDAGEDVLGEGRPNVSTENLADRSRDAREAIPLVVGKEEAIVEAFVPQPGFDAFVEHDVNWSVPERNAAPAGSVTINRP